MASFFNRLLRKKAPSPIEEAKVETSGQEHSPIERLSTESRALAAEGIPRLEVSQINVGVGQSIGVQRDNNEDALFTLNTNLLVDERSVKFGLFMVADGMGGHDNGELASRMAVDILTTHVVSTLFMELISSTRSTVERSMHEVMLDGVMKAHQAIKKETHGGGTTLTAAMILGDQLTITHVGDSRAYLFDPLGSTKLLTRDHSLVKRMEEVGQLTPEQALSDPRRNVLYRALGQGEPFEPDIASMQVGVGYQVLICSDGLWGLVSDGELAELVNSPMEPQLICQSLVDAANQAGGPDNISVILARIMG